MSETPLLDELGQISQEALGVLESAAGDAELESWRVAYLGRRGRLTLLLRQLGSLSVEERRSVGAEANRVKAMLEERFQERNQALKETERARYLAEGGIDVTLPGRPVPRGRLHPTTQMVRQILDAFVSMGFSVVEGPEVEWEHYNFDALNIPRDHPARDMWDTLWVDWEDPTPQGRRMLMRTHTSPMQARIMEGTKPPVRVVVPGKCYRYEASDATHEWHFYQVEGLAVDDGITFADLKGTLYEFARRIFGEERQGAVPLRLLPIRGARRGHVHRLLFLQGRGVPHLQGDGLDRDHGSGHGASARPGRRGLRLAEVHRLCLWVGAGAHRHAEVRHRRHTPLLHQRHALPAAVLGDNLSHVSGLTFAALASYRPTRRHPGPVL